jgi:uncharacterized protein (TIGR02271 family)
MKRRRPGDEDDGSPFVVRSEEELRVETTQHEVGRVRARKVIDTEHVSLVVPRNVEQADIERVAPRPDDSGQVETLPDGSVSIPVFEERLVVHKELAVVERVIIRKHRTGEQHEIEADLRRERIEIDVDPQLTDRVTGQTLTQPTEQPTSHSTETDGHPQS